MSVGAFVLPAGEVPGVEVGCVPLSKVRVRERDVAISAHVLEGGDHSDDETGGDEREDGIEVLLVPRLEIGLQVVRLAVVCIAHQGDIRVEGGKRHVENRARGRDGDVLRREGERKVTREESDLCSATDKQQNTDR